jgi:hypothetical protein
MPNSKSVSRLAECIAIGLIHGKAGEKHLGLMIDEQNEY